MYCVARHIIIYFDIDFYFSLIIVYMDINNNFFSNFIFSHIEYQLPLYVTLFTRIAIELETIFFEKFVHIKSDVLGG